VAINLQTAFLSPPVAMSAFYLKGVAPAHVTLNQIFSGMMPFMGIQVIMLILLYMFPGIGLWLPNYLYLRRNVILHRCLSPNRTACWSGCAGPPSC
jgi:TRAP-type mannitol/chloroaromatic compound transport system permease large subunit